jgi:O-antigen/teichoic acid export membrane protein
MAIAGPPQHVDAAAGSIDAPAEGHQQIGTHDGAPEDHARATPPARAVARGALALLSAQPLTWASTLLLVVMLPRYLADTEIGQAALGTSLAALVGPVCTLGLLDYLTRNLASRPKRELHEATLAWVVMTCTAVVGAFLLAVFVAVSGLDLGTPAVLIAAIGSVLITPTQGLLLTVLRAHERIGTFAIVNSVGLAATSLVPVIVVVSGGRLAEVVLSQLAVGIVAMVLSWWTSGIRLPRVHVSPRALLALIPLGLPFLGTTLATQFYSQINGILLAMLAPVETLGWYSAASRIVVIPMFVPVLIVTPLLPALSRCRADRGMFRHTLNASLRATLLVTLPICAAIATAAPGVPHFLGWPADFQPAAAPMTILAPQLTIVALDMMLGTALIALGLERKWLMVGLVACAVALASNFVGVPFAQTTWGNGGIGTAVAAILTECVMLVGALVIMPRGIVDRSMFWLVARMLIAAVPFVLLSRYLMAADVWLPLALTPGGVLFVVGALVLRVVSISEIRDIRRLGGQMVGAKLGRAGAR